MQVILMILQIAQTAGILGVLGYILAGGWKRIFRDISFFIDKQLVKLIGRVYNYFTILLEGSMFDESLVEELMKNIYIFIGVIVFFRLMMIVVKYLLNPDLVGDAKVGANALIKRVIIGSCGILFIPTIFDISLRLQSAVLNDNLIQQIIIPRDVLPKLENRIANGGKYIGTYVLAGFLSPSSEATESDIKRYNLGIEKGDLSNLDLNDGFFQLTFRYDYFFFISTLALGYVFYIILKYCIDLAVRWFKLLLYRLLAPIAMIEYMINGSQDGVYKNWLTATLSTYFMLFIRIMAIWFVIFVLSLMSPSSGTTQYAGSLLTNDDYFLRAIIIIGLLGFMMDLPKMVGQVFGLDLEQEGSATGLLKQVGGMVKTAAVGGLALGGAAVGSTIGIGKAALGALPGGRDSNGNKRNLSKAFSDAKKAQADKHPGINSINAASKTAFSGLVGSALGANQYTSSIYKGYQGQKQEQQRAAKEAEDLNKALDVKRKQKVHEELEAKQLDDIKNGKSNSETNIQQVRIDPNSLSALAGMMQASHNANGPTGQQQVQTIKIDPNSAAEMAGMRQASQSANTLTGQQQPTNVNVNQSGSAKVNNDKGPEFNVNGPLKTNNDNGLNGQQQVQTIKIDPNSAAEMADMKQVSQNANTLTGQQQPTNINVNVNQSDSAKVNNDKGPEFNVNGPVKVNNDKKSEVDMSNQKTTNYSNNSPKQ